MLALFLQYYFAYFTATFAFSFISLFFFDDEQLKTLIDNVNIKYPLIQKMIINAGASVVFALLLPIYLPLAYLRLIQYMHAQEHENDDDEPLPETETEDENDDDDEPEPEAAAATDSFFRQVEAEAEVEAEASASVVEAEAERIENAAKYVKAANERVNVDLPPSHDVDTDEATSETELIRHSDS